MKWDLPKRLGSRKIFRELEISEEFIQSEDDPAFSDFNLPLLDQEPMGSEIVRERHHCHSLEGWDA